MSGESEAIPHRASHLTEMDALELTLTDDPPHEVNLYPDLDL
jgi:hypothetical protein